MNRPVDMGPVKLKADVTCKYCGKLAKRKGATVSVIKDMDTSIQYVGVKCDNCGESYVTR